MKKFIINTLIKGFSIILPVLLSAYLLYFLVTAIEKTTHNLLNHLSASWLYFPGIGIALVLSIAFAFGLLMHQWLTRKLLNLADRLFRRVPLFGSIYSPIKDMLDVVSGDMSDNLGKPVIATLSDPDIKVLGFVMNDNSDNNSDMTVPSGYKPVFVQMGYQIGGFTLMIPEENISSAELSTEEGLRWALTAGLSSRVKKDK